MQQILFYFWQLCLLRESPEKLPNNPFVVGIVVAAYLLIALFSVALSQSDQSLYGIVGSVVIALFLQAIFIWLLVVFKEVAYRFVATLAALLGTNTIMLLILLPVNLTLLNAENESLKLLANSFSWVCLGWWLAIAGSIYHKATNISVLQGAAVAFMTELLAAVATFTLFPTSLP